MKFLKELFFMEASSLVKKGKTHTINESDMLGLPTHLNPRNIFFPEGEINWKTNWGHLWSVLKVAKSKLVPAYSWYFVATLFSLMTPVLVNRFVTMISNGITSAN